MSATNRGSVRMDQDAYFTPHLITYAYIPHLFPLGSRFRNLPVVDPAAGEGHLLYPLLKAGFPAASLYALELDAERAAKCAEAVGCAVSVGDTLVRCAEWAPSSPCTIISNPPYSLAFDFVKWGVSAAQRCGGRYAAFLRLNFLASVGRAAFFRLHPPSLSISPARPSFVRLRYLNPDGSPVLTEGGKPKGADTDATEYAWLLWDFSGAAYAPPIWLESKAERIHIDLVRAGFASLDKPTLEGPEAPILYRTVRG